MLAADQARSVEHLCDPCADPIATIPLPHVEPAESALETSDWSQVEGKRCAR